MEKAPLSRGEFPKTFCIVSGRLFENRQGGKPPRPLVFLILMLTLSSLSRAQNGFTQKDRELLIQLNTRINEMEKRFADLREDMNNRFGEMMTYIGILAAIFAAITVGTISFALWDRRTMIRPFESKVVDLDKKITENKDKYENLISALKEYADKNKKFADSIRQFNLF
jgi:uncharacterized protein YukE